MRQAQEFIPVPAQEGEVHWIGDQFVQRPFIVGGAEGESAAVRQIAKSRSEAEAQQIAQRLRGEAFCVSASLPPGK
jgi:hypothetical protein